MIIPPIKEKGLGIVEGGKSHTGPDADFSIGRLDMSLLATDLSESLREAEQRIGLLLSGNLGDLMESQKLALGSAGDALVSLGLFLSLMEMNGRGNRDTQIPETFDLTALLRTTAEELDPAARSKGIDIRLRLPDKPMTVRAWREGVKALIRFTMRERLRVSPVWERICVAGHSSEGVHSISVTGSGSIDLKGTTPHSGIALARSILDGCGGSLLFPDGGNEWALTFPVPRKSRKRIVTASVHKPGRHRPITARTYPS